MKFLKDFVRQKAQPEGSMATGYSAYEALFYCSEAVRSIDPGAPSILRLDITKNVDKVKLPKSFEEKFMTTNMHNQVRYCPTL